jgi:phosphatidylglycerol:prolipoprotein diacylglycerol transferase
MRRVLFTVRGVRIWSYPALLYVGLVSGFYVMWAIAPSLGLRRGPAAAALLILLAPAVIGARLWFVLDHWTVYRREPRRIWRHSEGGLALYGGLVLALVLSPAVLGGFGVRFAGFWDGATFTILVGMMFARVGCLLNGCCAGRPSQGWLGLWLPDHAGRRERRYPVQLIELTAAAVLLAGSASLLVLHAPRGTIFAFGLAGYASVRLALDRLRAPAARSVTSQRAALATFLACSAAIFVAGWLVGAT